jgi:hypothetical protein
MPDYPLPHLAEKFMSAFRGHPSRYGRTILTGGHDDKGKANSRSWLEKFPVTTELWEDHLKGGEALGIVPVTEKNQLNWAAFDVDVYFGLLDFPTMLATIAEHKLPFIPCRSKSGGGHVYVFFKEPANCKKVMEKLNEFTAFFGYGRCEVFPKQETLVNTTNDDIRWGSWLNMPYNGPISPRYAMKEAGMGGKPDLAYTASEFMDLVDERAIDPEIFYSMDIPNQPKEGAEPTEDQPFPDGPPCLNTLWVKHSKEKGIRDTMIFNLGVYLKKKYPESWRDELVDLNKKLKYPLEDKVMETKKRTLEKDYSFQCLTPELRKFCQGSKCAKRTCGIDSDGLSIENQSLIQLRTDPSLWFLTDKRVQIALEGQYLWDYEKVRIAFMEAGQIILPPMKRDDWHKQLKDYLKVCTVVDVPPESTAKGELIEHLEHWRKTAGYDRKNLLNNQPVIDGDGGMLFKMKDLKDILRIAQFRALQPNKIVETIRNELGGTDKEIRLDGTHVRCWSIPKEKLTAAPDMQMGDVEPEGDHF